jgi:hypothetical protein
MFLNIFSEKIELFEIKLDLDVHCMVLYNLYVFLAHLAVVH